jgi:hypothetical protein
MRLLILALGFGCIAIIAFAPRSAEALTAADRAACKPDVFRLCSAGAIAAATFGDRQGIYDCFKQHRHELSPACDRVLRKSGY